MEIYQFVSPPLATNVYLVWCGKTSEAIVIDPAMASEDILFYIRPRRIKIKYIVNTHAHFDHVWENAELKKATGAKLCIGKADAKLLAKVDSMVPVHIRAPLKKVAPDKLLKEKDKIVFGKEELSVLHTPGHTPGSICLYNKQENRLFSGDTLFARTYGRTDLPHSNPKQMDASLKRLAKLPKETTIFPGHGSSTVLGKEGWLQKYKKK